MDLCASNNISIDFIRLQPCLCYVSRVTIIKSCSWHNCNSSLRSLEYIDTYFHKKKKKKKYIDTYLAIIRWLDVWVQLIKAYLDINLHICY